MVLNFDPSNYYFINPTFLHDGFIVFSLRDIISVYHKYTYYRLIIHNNNKKTHYITRIPLCICCFSFFYYYSIVLTSHTMIFNEMGIDLVQDIKFNNIFWAATFYWRIFYFSLGFPLTIFPSLFRWDTMKNSKMPKWKNNGFFCVTNPTWASLVA